LNRLKPRGMKIKKKDLLDLREQAVVLREERKAMAKALKKCKKELKGVKGANAKKGLKEEIDELHKNIAEHDEQMQDINEKVDVYFQRRPEYKELFHLIMYRRVKLSIDEIKDEAGNALKLYPREDKRIPGVVAWIEEKGDPENDDFNCYVHITRAFWNAVKKEKGGQRRKEIVAQCIAHEHRERNSQGSFHGHSHGQAVKDELLFSSEDAIYKEVSDLNLLLLDYAVNQFETTGDDHYLYELMWIAYDPKKDLGGYYRKQFADRINDIKNEQLLRKLLIKFMFNYHPDKDPGQYCKNSFLRRLNEINEKDATEPEEMESEDLLVWYWIQVIINKKDVEEITLEINKMIDEGLREEIRKEVLIEYVPFKKRMDDSYERLKNSGVPEERFYQPAEDIDVLYLPQIRIPLGGDSKTGFTSIKCPYNMDTIEGLEARKNELLKAAQKKGKLPSIDDFLQPIIDGEEFPEAYNAAREIKILLEDYKTNRKTRYFLEKFDVYNLEHVVRALKLSVYSEGFVDMIVQEILIKNKLLKGEPILVNIIAAGGAGKTTLCKMIESAIKAKKVEGDKVLKVLSSSTDHFLMDRPYRREPSNEGTDVMQGPKMYRARDKLLPFIETLKSGNKIRIPKPIGEGRIDFSTEPVDSPDVFILEGVMSGHGQLADKVDISIGISEASDDRRLSLKMERDVLPETLGGREDEELYILNDFRSKQFEEQQETIKVDMLGSADYVWRFVESAPEKNLAYVREESAKLVYGRLVSKFGQEPEATKSAMQKVREYYKSFKDIDAALYLFEIYVEGRLPPEADTIWKEEVQDITRTHVPQVIIATMANNILELEKGSDLKKIDNETAALLTMYLKEAAGGVLVLISGGSKDEMINDVLCKIDKSLWNRIILCPCSGSRVLMYNPDKVDLATGERGVYTDEEDTEHHFKLVKNITEAQRKKWEEIIDGAVKKFGLDKSLPQVDKRTVKINLREDLIVFEMINRASLNSDQAKMVNDTILKNDDVQSFEITETEETYDLRKPVAAYLNAKFKEADLPISAEIASGSGLDTVVNCTVEGLGLREAAIKTILENNLLERAAGVSQGIEDEGILVAARHYPAIRRKLPKSPYVIFSWEKIEEEKDEDGKVIPKPKLFLGSPYNKGFKQFMHALLCVHYTEEVYGKYLENMDKAYNPEDDLNTDFLSTPQPA